MTTTNQQTWAPGVIARYYTKAAEITGDLSLRVDIHEESDGARYVARCTGCTASWWNSRTDWNLEYMVRPWAHKHAQECRAEAPPEADQ